MHYPPLLLALLPGPALAAFSFNSVVTAGFTFDGRLPTTGVSSACSAAYSESIACDATFLQLPDTTVGPSLFTKAGLEKVCTTGCIDALNAWDKKLQEACTAQDKLFADEQKLEYLSTALDGNYMIQENLYWPFCLRDSTTGTFCLIDDTLPEWPTVTGATKASITTFCGSDCRMQESFLMNLYYNDYDLVDAEAECPGLNVSSLPMSVNMQAAFGTTLSSQEGVVGKNTGGKILGGDYSWEFLVTGGARASASGSTGSKSSTLAGDQKGAASRVGVSGVLGVFVGLAVSMLV